VIVGVESVGYRVGRLPPGGEAEWLDWATDIARQCRAADVPVFVKQIPLNGQVCHDVTQFPPELQVRQFPK
jgi:hypothetical protein